MSERKTNTVHFGPEALRRDSEHSVAEIQGRLRQIESLVDQGKSVSDAVKEIGITEETYDRWRDRYGDTEVVEANRQDRLAHESARLKRITGFLAETKSTLDKRISKNTGRDGR